MRTNRAKEKLLAGEIVVGTHLSLASPALAEMCGYLGFDFVIVDLEHLLFNPESFEGIVRAADVTGMTSIFRPTKNDPDLLLPYLDAGAQGVFVPHVATAEAARRVVQAVRYPPDGSRGAGSERAAQYGLVGTPAEHVRESNRQTLATVSMIDGVSPTYVNVARIMGATRRQIFLQVILPAILPGLFLILRLNLFAAWMIVKLVCWLGLSALAGIGYRRRGAVCVLKTIASALVLVAVVAVYTKLAF